VKKCLGLVGHHLNIFEKGEEEETFLIINIATFLSSSSCVLEREGGRWNSQPGGEYNRVKSSRVGREKKK